MNEIKVNDLMLYHANSADHIPIRIVKVDSEIIEFERQDLKPPGTIKVLRIFYNVIEKQNDLVLTFNNIKK